MDSWLKRVLYVIKPIVYSNTELSARYGFEALFCNPAEGHEKGLVEGLVGWARRNTLPVPHVDSLQELETSGA